MTPDLERIEALAKYRHRDCDTLSGPCGCGAWHDKIRHEDILALVARVRELTIKEDALNTVQHENALLSSRVRELERGLNEVRGVSAQNSLVYAIASAALDGAKGEAHGPQCRICHGKGWLNTADQNALEDGAKGGNVAS